MMNNVIIHMLERYEAKTTDQYKNALKEIIQEIALLGLARAKFFEHAAFYGGSALRIFYGLDRFSEDLDFSLLETNSDFDIAPYCSFVQDELSSYGFHVSVEKKQKAPVRKVESAFIKANTLQHLIKIKGIENPKSGTHANERLKIKFEVDTDPPGAAGYDSRMRTLPVPYSVKLYAPSSLLAGKIHAFLFRQYGSGKVKGRDMYDFIWLVSRDTHVNLKHLEMRMRQTGHWKNEYALTLEELKKLLHLKADTINYESAKADARPFLSRPEAVDAWRPELIKQVSESLKIVKN